MENYFFLSTGKLYFLDNAVDTLEETNVVCSSVWLINVKAKLGRSLLKLKRRQPPLLLPPQKNACVLINRPKNSRATNCEACAIKKNKFFNSNNIYTRK